MIIPRTGQSSADWNRKILKRTLSAYWITGYATLLRMGNRFVLDGRFAYVDDEKQTMSYKDLKRRVKNFSIFGDEFYELYWPEYAPPACIQFKKQKLIEWARESFLKPNQQQKK